MNALRDHAWQDMTCTVEAGCPWAAMQVGTRRHGQMVALDPLWPDRATVGGIVACNDSGALRLKFGGLRDLIIGMTIVLADGTIAKSGGKVVKNVAGYDLHKLMTGSFRHAGRDCRGEFPPAPRGRTCPDLDRAGTRTQATARPFRRAASRADGLADDAVARAAPHDEPRMRARCPHRGRPRMSGRIWSPHAKSSSAG